MPMFYVDGETKNNGQRGFQESSIAVADEEGKIIIEEFVGDKTNIESEALAIIHILRKAKDEKITPITVLSDSEFWVKAVNLKWNLKKQRLFPLRDELQQLMKKTKARLMWIPREQNLAGIYFDNSKRKNKLQMEKMVCPECGHKFFRQKTLDTD